MQDFDVFARYLSYQRLGAYKSRDTNPITLYKWNISLSEALYPLLNTVEISLRNCLHIAISELINDDNWLFNRNPKILQLLHPHWVVKIDSNIKEMSVKQKLDEGHLIAELPFGFWTVLLSKKFEHKQFLWPRLKKHVFPFAHGIKINVIRDQFNHIRYLRNSVFHYEAIWHWQDLQERHDAIIQAIRWINPILLNLISQVRFKEIYNSGPRMALNATVETVEFV